MVVEGISKCLEAPSKRKTKSDKMTSSSAFWGVGGGDGKEAAAG